jgi:glycosyltransferase involved in cell wall biosynthesis
MRVAIITESFPPDVNGVAHCVLPVAELLARSGHHPLVIAPQPPRASWDEKTSYPFPVVRVPAVPLPGYPGFRLGLPGRRVRAALIGHRAELVHLASPVVLGAHGAAVARRLGLPTVAVYQTDLPSYARAYRFGQAGEAFAWRWPRGIHNVVLVPLGVDLDTFSPRVRRPRTRYAGEGQVLLVHCGRLSAEKRPQRSLTTLATLRAAGLPVRLVVAGDGPLRARLVRRAARAGLPVTFAGFLSGRADLAALLASADVAIAPGPAETFGLAALEALACGTPVVVSAESALPEVVGDAGASVPGEDLAVGVRAVLARPERSRRAAARARAEQYDWGTAARGFLAAHGAEDCTAIRRRSA